MPSALDEKLAWYTAGEDRTWKRRLQALELVVFATLVASAVVAVALAPGKVKLPFLFHLFAAGIAIPQLMLAPFFLRDTLVPRYVRSLILFGFLCGSGALTGFALVLFVDASSG